MENNETVKETSALEDCTVFLSQGRKDVITFIRNYWLKDLYGGSLKSLDFDCICKLEGSRKEELIRNSASRFSMRKAEALGLMKWGIVVLTAMQEYGESVALEVCQSLFSGDKDITLEEILPSETFGTFPLGRNY